MRVEAAVVEPEDFDIPRELAPELDGWESDLAEKVVGWLLPSTCRRSVDEATARRFLSRLSGRADHLGLLRRASLIAGRRDELVEFAEVLLPQLCRVLPSRSETVRRVRQGGFAGRLDIPRTTRFRIAGDPSRFVVRNRRRSFALPENVLVRGVVDELLGVLGMLRRADVLANKGWGAVARRCEGALRLELEGTKLREVPDQKPGSPEIAAALAARHPAYALAADWYLALTAALRSSRPEYLARLLAKGALMPLSRPARFELAVLLQLLETFHGRLEPLGFTLERTLVAPGRKEFAALRRDKDVVQLFHDHTPPTAAGPHDRGAAHYLGRGGRMRPDVSVIIRRNGVMVGGVVVEVKLTQNLAYAQQGFAEALIYAREYPAFLKGWPKAILVTTAPVPGKVKPEDEVVAIGWPDWVPEEVVDGILEPLTG